MVTLNRDDMITGLRELVAELHARGATASIHSNTDVDEIAHAIAQRRGWPADWLNCKASTFIPIATEPLWEPLHDDETVSVWVATPASLLAMKLRAPARPAIPMTSQP